MFPFRYARQEDGHFRSYAQTEHQVTTAMEDYPEIPMTFEQLQNTLGIDSDELSIILEDMGMYCTEEGEN